MPFHPTISQFSNQPTSSIPESKKGKSQIRTDSVSQPMVSSPSGAEQEKLFLNALSGDSNAYWELVQPHVKILYATAHAILLDSDAAKQICHTALIRSFSTLGNLRHPREIPRSFHVISRQMALDYQKKQGNHAEKHHEDSSLAAQLMKEEDVAALEASLQRLPESFRIALSLRYLTSLSFQEIAGVLDISEAEARDRLKEARKLLKNYHE